MGHIAHLRNQFKSINTFEQSYDYMYIYHEISPVILDEKILNLKFAQYYRRRRFFNFLNVFW